MSGRNALGTQECFPDECFPIVLGLVTISYTVTEFQSSPHGSAGYSGERIPGLQLSLHKASISWHCSLENLICASQNISLNALSTCLMFVCVIPFLDFELLEGRCYHLLSYSSQCFNTSLASAIPQSRNSIWTRIAKSKWANGIFPTAVQILCVPLSLRKTENYCLLSLRHFARL